MQVDWLTRKADLQRTVNGCQAQLLRNWKLFLPMVPRVTLLFVSFPGSVRIEAAGYFELRIFSEFLKTRCLKNLPLRILCYFMLSVQFL